MPRQAKLDTSEVLHHVMGGGIKGVSIFRTDEDREDFLARVEALCEREPLSVYDWVLIDTFT